MKKLKRNLNLLIKKGLKFIEGIEPSDQLILIYHSDLDGICSATIFLSALKNIGIVPKVKYFVGAHEALRKVLDDRTLSNYKKIVVLDIGLQQLERRIKVLKRNLLIIDHHIVMSDFNGKNVIYVNPRFKNPETYQPVSYFLYKILSHTAHIKNLEWVSALGTVADYGFDDCKDILSKYGIRKKTDLEKSRLWKAAVILNGAFAIIGFDEGLKIFMKAENINELVKNERLRTASNIFNKEYTKVERGFWKDSMCDDELNLIFSVIESKYKRIASALVTDISIQYPEKVVILLEKLGKSYKVHARHQAGKINLGEIMMRCCNGGGHRQAAGGIVGEHEIDDFREKIVRELESYSR